MGSRAWEDRAPTLALRAGTHLLSASSAAEWADAVTRLLDDRALRRRLGAEGRRYVEAHHRWDRCLEAFAPLLGLGDSPRERRPADPSRS